MSRLTRALHVLVFAPAAKKKRNAGDPLGQWLISTQSSINSTFLLRTRSSIFQALGRREGKEGTQRVRWHEIISEKLEERTKAPRTSFLSSHFIRIKQQSVSVEELSADSYPWKFDVLETRYLSRREANMLVLMTSTFQGATISRQFQDMRPLCLNCSPLNYQKIILNYFNFR